MFRRRAALLALLALLLSALASLTPAAAAGPVCTVAASGGTYSSVAAALADPGCVTIQVAAGTFATNVTISRPVVIEGAGPASTRLDGGGMDRFQRVITVESGGPIELRNLALVNGDANNLPGGALFNGGALTLTNVLVQGNAGVNAGGIRNVGTMTIVGSSITENRGRSVGGVLNDGTLTIRDSAITANSGNTGAIISTGALTLVNTAVSGNTAPAGPALNIFQGTALIESSAISGNSGGDSAQSLPAGLLANPGTTVTLRGTTLLRNGPGANCQGTISSQGGNLSDDASCGAAAAALQAQLFLPALQQ